MADDWERQVFDNKHSEIQEFLTSKQTMGRSPRTLNEYSRVLKKVYHEHFPDLAPAETEVRHIEEYVAILDDRGLASNTKRRYLECLSAFFTWAMKRPRFEEITGNPAAVVLEEFPREIRTRPDCATWENGKQIIHNITNPRNKTIAIVLAKTGCRLTEALEIELDDLMLEEGFIRLRKRKGGKQTVVPIDQETIRAIERFMYVRPDDPGTDYLFVSIRGDRVSRERVRRVIRKAAVDAGVMQEGEKRFHKKFTPHTYRTVFTTLMRNQGMSDHVLRYIRGDSNSETMDIYTRVDRNEAREDYLDCIKPLNI
ncbi:tyrosine-type recombinase/integrase [Halosolutus halophilus]|uniref:tyrosine-type recombinase/integrase n=1 Tax=Halosolutus halophilus TaxID=1552990 RepID=UPI002234FD2C|nr:tyrosine-type recombinase/integrase [Halosolutus halophilus]